MITGSLLAVVIGPGKSGRKPMFNSPEWLKYYCLIGVIFLVFFVCGIALGEAKKNPSAWIIYLIIPVSLIIIWVAYNYRVGYSG